MNPQLFRHLMIKLYGILHPDDTETGRLTLGHTTSATIARNYAENRTDNAFKRWDDTLAQFRDKPPSFPITVLGGRPNECPLHIRPAQHAAI